ncbi:MAG: SAM-dependent methyltransferase [Clostridia bacterium]|nr:SAM-dependent methyltransferase [Clostridia bacterium]
MNKNNEPCAPRLDKRLACAANFVREGATVADVGTDHAYLPIALCLSGRAVGGVVTDINKGPIDRASENIKAHGLEHRLCAMLTDGLCGAEKYLPTDITVLGMGGELIAGIISRAEWTKDRRIRLCLQPMTHAEILRKYLADNGYSIVDEALVREDKIYQIIVAEYSGRTEEYTLAELYFGRINIDRGGVELNDLLCSWERILSVRIAGKEGAGERADEERELQRQISEIKNKGETK